jgi:hypothetical protein
MQFLFGTLPELMKSKLPYYETTELLKIAFEHPLGEARGDIFRRLQASGFNEAQFFDALEEHVLPMNLSSEKWLRLFRMYRTGQRFI